MKNLKLQEIQEIKKQYDGPGGNDINNNFWARRLADHFPEILRVNQKGDPDVIVFMGKVFKKD